MLEQSSNKDVEFIKLWTVKEAISKYEGMGLHFPFDKMDKNRYRIVSGSRKEFCYSVCYGKTSDEKQDIKIHSVSMKELIAGYKI